MPGNLLPRISWLTEGEMSRLAVHSSARETRNPKLVYPKWQIGRYDALITCIAPALRVGWNRLFLLP